MAYCSSCGVEVEAHAQRCPLCDAPIQRLVPEPAAAPRYPALVAMTGRQTRYLVWAVSTAALLSVALAIGTVDWLWNHRATWSVYPLTGIAVLWVLLTLIVVLARRPIFVIVGQAVATTGFLVAIDLASNRRLDWFLSLALPIAGIGTAASLFVWAVVRATRRAAAPIAAAVLLVCAAGSVAVDLLVSAHLGSARLSWSLIVLGAAAPLIGFLAYFHWRLARQIQVEGLLHS